MSHRMICYGDSNTYGYDPRSYFGGRYPRTVRWTALLEDQGWEIINEGENGRPIPRSKQEIVRVRQAFDRLHPKIMMVMLGTNDLLQDPRLSAEACAKRMERFLTELLRENAAMEPQKLFLMTPPPMEPGDWTCAEVIETSQQLAEPYKAVAHRLKLHFADAGAWNIQLCFDGVHFSEEGHRVFADRAGRALAALNQEAAP